MSRFKRSGEIELHGETFVWNIRHWGGVSRLGEDLRGISVSVNHDTREGRELVLDFDVADYWFKKPQSHGEFQKRLIATVELAITGGWDPDSRGKAFRFSVPELDP
jgi:hypothetical protein